MVSTRKILLSSSGKSDYYINLISDSSAALNFNNYRAKPIINSSNNIIDSGSSTNLSNNSMYLISDIDGNIDTLKNVGVNLYDLDTYGSALDDSGNVYLFGDNRQLSGSSNAFISKINSSGTQQFATSNDNSNNARIYGAEVGSSYIACCGLSVPSSASRLTAWVYDTSGNLQWEGAINPGSPISALGECAAVQPSSQSTDTCCFGGMIGDRPYIFQSTLGSGSHVRYQWGGSSFDDGRFADVIYDSSGFIVAVGWLESGTTFNPMIVRFDSTLALGTGTFTSVSTISDFSAHYSVVTDSSDNIYVGGNSNNSYETHILKYNSSGTFQWGILIRDSSGASTNNRVNCYNLGLDSDENIIASGNTSAVSGSTSDYDHMTLRYPNDGSITGTFGDFTISSVTPTAGTLSAAFANGAPTEESFSTSQTNYTQTIADRSQATISTTLTSIY